MIEEFLAAVSFLTRLPVGGWVRGAWPAAVRCVWAYPLVGALVGACGAMVVAAARAVGIAPLLAALFGVAAMVLLTGALHEDGLADVADGFGGGRTRAGKLAIMRDSRVGSYGVMALVLAVGMRAAAVAGMAHPWAGLIAAGALSRAALLVPTWLGAARADGLAAGLGRPDPARIAVACGLAVLCAVLVLSPLTGVVAALAAFAVAGGMAALAWRQIGGYTGDVLGASAVLAEIAALAVV